MKRAVRIGAGAGSTVDRIEPATELAERGNLDFLVFECLGERTLGTALQRKLLDPSKGYDSLLEDRITAVLPACVKGKVRIVTNMGAANPETATDIVLSIALGMGYDNLTVATVTGDDVMEYVQLHAEELQVLGSTDTVASFGTKLFSAHAYLGYDPIVQSLQRGADIVITGRTADTSLFLAPAAHAFGWSCGDWDRLAGGVAAGHLLECSGQVTGGYFADPGYKDVPDLSALGFPVAEVREDGSSLITKVEGTGGRVDLQTCKEQLLYEIHDPAGYVTPDVVADFSAIRFQLVGKDRVAVTGAKGRPKTPTLLVSLGVREGFIGEGEISYGGPGAYSRAKLAGQVVQERLSRLQCKISELRIDYIGVNSMYQPAVSEPSSEPGEVRLRVAGRTNDRRSAEQVGLEVEALYTAGPAGGGGARKYVRDVLAIYSTLIPRSAVRPEVEIRGLQG